ncbi:MAG TPA: porin, partial [Ignavibacteriaceae bacterium]|nr:porin [Ignavibacteriaceae bacterium]
KEESQNLGLLDHTFESFNYANVYGKRFGYLGDFWFIANPVLLRGELFQYNFNASLSNGNEVKNFLGGYLEAGYFLFGNVNDGVQLIGRFETARYGKTIQFFPGPTELNSYILGTNWYSNTIFTFQVNLIYEEANKNSVLRSTRLYNRNNEFEILSTVQLKF